MFSWTTRSAPWTVIPLDSCSRSSSRDLSWLTAQLYVPFTDATLSFVLNVIIQILVTHHVELVIPGAHYLVRMLDGRIDTQGTIKDLRTSGVLDDIAPAEELEAHKEEQALEVEENPNAEIDAEAPGDGEAADKSKKKPRKLIEEEHRETGSVKWNIYNTYLEASCVSLKYLTWQIHLAD